jgi:hypothetical protein
MTRASHEPSRLVVGVVLRCASRHLRGHSPRQASSCETSAVILLFGAARSRTLQSASRSATLACQGGTRNHFDAFFIAGNPIVRPLFLVHCTTTGIATLKPNYFLDRTGPGRYLDRFEMLSVRFASG